MRLKFLLNGWKNWFLIAKLPNYGVAKSFLSKIAKLKCSYVSLVTLRYMYVKWAGLTTGAGSESVSVFVP